MRLGHSYDIEGYRVPGSTNAVPAPCHWRFRATPGDDLVAAYGGGYSPGIAMEKAARDHGLDLEDMEREFAWILLGDEQFAV